MAGFPYLRSEPVVIIVMSLQLVYSLLSLVNTIRKESAETKRVEQEEAEKTRLFLEKQKDSWFSPEGQKDLYRDFTTNAKIRKTGCR